MQLRSHQQELLKLCHSINESGKAPKQIIASVTPGGGKSSIPVILATQLVPRFADRICWLVPRAALQQQGQEAFRHQGFRDMFDHRLHIGQSFDEGCGIVATYQGLLANQQRFEREFQRHRYILILDEPHHAPDESEWAAALEPLVRHCAMLVQMSGTFQRHDNKPVAFLPYRDEGDEKTFNADIARAHGIPVIEYTRSQALLEKAIIPLEVRWFDLAATWEEDGEQRSLFSIAELEDTWEVTEAIYLSIRTGAAENILMHCYEDWLQYRKTNRRSKLLVVAANVPAAKQYKERLEKAGAQRIDIATSRESRKAHKNIDKFKSHGPNRLDILVTVAMAYEGLDVPPITHIACATNIRSIPWIEQMVARETRVDYGDGAPSYANQVAYLYCSDDALMRQCVQGIIEDQDAIARVPRKLEDYEKPEQEPETEPKHQTEFKILDSEALLTGFNDLEGNGLTKAEIDQIPLLSRVTGTSESILRSMKVTHLRGQLRANQAAITNYRETVLYKPIVRPVSADPEEMSLTGLRAKATTLAKKLDAIANYEPGTANSMVVRHFRKSRTKMTAEELWRVCQWLEERVSSYSQPAFPVEIK